MSKPVLAIDIDEVIFPMVDDLIKYVDNKHSVKLNTQEFLVYRVEDIWPGGPEQGEKVFQDYMSQSGVEVAPVEGAKEALEKLSETYELIVMTYRAEEVGEATQKWLNHQFPELFKNVHILGSNKKGFKYKSKGEVCKELNVYCLIDDQPANVISANENGIKAILFGEYPWNKTENLPAGIIRAKDWQGALELL